MKLNTPPPPGGFGGGRVLRPPGRRLDNWLQTYAEFTSDNEASPLFHLWAGLSALSAVSGRQVYFNMGKFFYLTNLYTVLVGPPGSKKSTAMNNARRLVKRVPGIHLGSNVASVESIIKRMATIPDVEHQSLTVYSLELGTFLGEGTNQRHMTDFLCDFFDGFPDFEKDTLSRGSEKLTNPWFSFQACTVPEWLQTNLSSQALDGGFVSRTLWIYNADRRLTAPWPENNPRLDKLQEDLVNDLIHISTLQGEFKATPAAKAFYSAWYMNPARFPGAGVNRMGGYYDRKHVHVMKLAMLMSLAESDSLLVEVRDFQAALALLEEIEPEMQKAFVGVGKNPNSPKLERYLEQIRRGGDKGIPEGFLIAANYHDTPTQSHDEVMNTLRKIGKIRRVGSQVFINGE